MIRTVEDLARGAIELPPDQRFTLARKILASVEPEEEASVRAAWDLEIRERIRRYDAGETTSLPGPAVFAEIDRLIGHDT